MAPLFQHIIALAGRILLSLIFVASAAHHIVNWNSTVETMVAEGMGGSLESGTTAFCHAMLALAVVFLLAGGLSVLLGIFARWGAVLLIAFLIPATAIFHDFWRLDPASVQYQMEMANFMKNIALIGGLMMVLAYGAGGLRAEKLMSRGRGE